jgi:hypothetical protein
VAHLGAFPGDGEGSGRCGGGRRAQRGLASGGLVSGKQICMIAMASSTSGLAGTLTPASLAKREGRVS